MKVPTKSTGSTTSADDDFMSTVDNLGNLIPPAAAPDGFARKTYPVSSLNFNASTGRSIAIDQGRGIDAARAIGMVEMRLAQNKVRLDVKKQRFHERPGLKRKRLASERYRRRFRTGFAEMTRKVRDMARKGW